MFNLLKGKNYTLSMLLGVMLAFSLPPFFIVAFLFISFSVYYIVLSKATSKHQAFCLGWWFGFGYFAIGLYWFYFALSIDIKLYGWLIPLAILGIPGILAIYFAIASWAIYSLKYRKFLGLVVFALIFTISEWCRGFLFPFFPWNLISYSWTFSNEMMQIISVVGIYGLVFITVFCAASVGVYYQDNSKISYLSAVLMIISIFTFGILRLMDAHNVFYDDVRLRLVQGNVIQKSDFSFQEREAVVNKYLSLTHDAGISKITHVIWPESAVPFVLNEKKSIPFLSLKGTGVKFLVTGGLRITKKDNKDMFYNSLFAINKDGIVVDFYDKHHLVPFGEYIPLLKYFKRWLPWLNAITGDFNIGDETRKNISLDDLPTFSPLICYESIFPGEVTNSENPAKWLLNITNDAWFGISTEPFQHFEMSRMRSIEEGIPLVRVSNNGISAVVDSYGRIIKLLAIDVEGHIDTSLPMPLETRTIYAKYVSHKRILVFFIVCIIFFIVFKRKNSKYK